MTINLKAPDIRELKPRITVFGVGGAGGNAVNNMIESGLQGVEFVVMNTDAQALLMSKAERVIQAGLVVTQGLGAGSHPEVGRAAAEEVMEEIRDHLVGAHMTFVTAGMGGGTGTGAAPIVAKVAREMGILTVGVVTKPFHFEGQRRMRVAEQGIADLQASVDTLIVIPNQNLFRVANEKTTFADAFAMADQVLYSGVACITDLMVKEGLINLDFADVRAVMREMGKAMMGTGESSGEKRALQAAEAAIANPLLDETSMKGARGLLISISGGNDMTLYEVDEAATRIREEVDQEANIIVGATFDQALEGVVRVSVVATGIDQVPGTRSEPASTINSKARASRKSPTRMLGAPPQIRWAATFPRRRSEPSTTSSCRSVAVWMNSTAVASFRNDSSEAPARRAAATVSSGRSRLPPAEMMCSPSAGMTGTSLVSRSPISASTFAMSGLASLISRSTEALEGASAALAASKTWLLAAATPIAGDTGVGIGHGQGEHKRQRAFHEPFGRCRQRKRGQAAQRAPDAAAAGEGLPRRHRCRAAGRRL